ncbi:hypothetical protein GcM3_023016 [Golovinomyces cichoracearum]|uniref:Uncharacterized protein n=1 Tax=Golovinomyces cichoracearum TaxID=62708 RepID=A0A420J739_9PEZI|nr:hypothetical protein GcM3_023016 [Golovinomyces cichoracearum]
MLLDAIEDLVAARLIQITPSNINNLKTNTYQIPKKNLGKSRPLYGDHSGPKQTPLSDRRVMVRLDKNNPIRAHGPTATMKKVNEIIEESRGVKDAYVTTSGIALALGDDLKV